MYQLKKGKHVKELVKNIEINLKRQTVNKFCITVMRCQQYLM